ncbi:unnamed protein product [Microthlaspi erraticum]|uniref:NYN domain-containing protein n=1 Tax=Microthlaspi erraticum TaxID=1685480 RepID=A0A6D2IYW3_9BRAS|nr:unnamed protein product [Microthlaspi erraticum]
MSSTGGSGRIRYNRRSKSPETQPAVLSISRGKLNLTVKQQEALNKKKERRMVKARTTFCVLMDVDQITRELRVTNPGFDVDTLQRRVQAFLKKAAPSSKIHNGKLVGVGNMRKFFAGQRRSTTWEGVYVHDTFARTLQCKHCDRVFCQAYDNNRKTAMYESLTDVADAYLEHLILSHARKYPDHKLLIIGGDRDFVRCIDILGLGGGEVYLALSDSCSLDFKNAVEAKHTVPFSVIVATPPAPKA